MKVALTQRREIMGVTYCRVTLNDLQHREVWIFKAIQQSGGQIIYSHPRT